MKKILLAGLSSLLVLILIHTTNARQVTCEDLEYRLHLTRTDIELTTRLHHDSAHKSAFLRELQDHERYLQDEIRNYGCFR